MGDTSTVDAGVDAGAQSAAASAKAGDFSGAAVQKAIETGGAVVGAAACTAVGAPELAPLCGAVAGKIIGAIASSLGDLFQREFGGPTPQQLGFAAMVHAAPHIQEAVIENFVSLGKAAMQIDFARATANLPPVDAWQVLAYLGAELVPTDTAHPYIEPGTFRPKVGAWWNYSPRPAGGGEWPDPSDPSFPMPLAYQWGNPWMPPDFYGYQSTAVDPATGAFAIVGAPGNFSLLNYKTMGPDEINARLAALDKRIADWRKALLTAAMIAVSAIGTEAAAREIQRQTDALAAAKVVADQQAATTGQLVELAQLIELAASIAEQKTTLESYGRGVTNGVTFLRTTPPPNVVDAFAAAAAVA